MWCVVDLDKEEYSVDYVSLDKNFCSFEILTQFYIWKNKKKNLLENFTVSTKLRANVLVFLYLTTINVNKRVKYTQFVYERRQQLKICF